MTDGPTNCHAENQSSSSEVFTILTPDNPKNDQS